MFGHVGHAIEGSHGLDLFNGVLGLVEFSGIGIKHPLCIQSEMLDHERVHGLSLDVLVAVLLPWEMGILHLVKSVKILVHRLSVGVFDLRRILRPVPPHGN